MADPKIIVDWSIRLIRKLINLIWFILLFKNVSWLLLLKYQSLRLHTVLCDVKVSIFEFILLLFVAITLNLERLRLSHMTSGLTFYYFILFLFTLKKTLKSLNLNLKIFHFPALASWMPHSRRERNCLIQVCTASRNSHQDTSSSNWCQWYVYIEPFNCTKM